MKPGDKKSPDRKTIRGYPFFIREIKDALLSTRRSFVVQAGLLTSLPF